MNASRQLEELIALFEDPRSCAHLLESGPNHLLVEFLCKGPVKLPDGRIEIVEGHRVRFVTREDVPGAVLTLYEPQQGVLWHPNSRPEPPLIVCADHEAQIARRGFVPLVSTANLVFEIVTGNEWNARHGIYNRDALDYFAALQTEGKLPFDTRRLI